MKIQPNAIYNSKLLKKGLLLASENSALFAAGASLALSTIARPIAIALTPKTEEENKKFAVAKSFASSLSGFLMTFLITKPVSKAIKNINDNPKEFLSRRTIENLKGAEINLLTSKKYNFATQLFKLGLGFFIAAPKSLLTSKLVKPLIDKAFPKKETEKTTKDINFKGSFTKKYINTLSNGISSTINSKTTQDLAEKFHKTNFEQHMMNLTDIFTTGVFIATTMNNKKIQDKRKKVLSINAALSTGLSVLGGLGLNKLIEKPVEKFTQAFKEANKNSPDLGKYLEGIRVTKSVLILGGIYYIIIPILSTFFAERIEKKIGEKFNKEN